MFTPFASSPSRGCASSPRNRANSFASRRSSTRAARSFLFSSSSAACASLGAVGYFMSSAKGLAREPLAGHVIAAIGTVMLSWLVVHTVFTLHYACLYYLDPAPKAREEGCLSRRAGIRGRLPRFRLLLFCHRDDVPSLGHSNLLEADPPLGAPPRDDLLCLQCRHPRPEHQHHLRHAVKMLGTRHARAYVSLLKRSLRNSQWITF